MKQLFSNINSLSSAQTDSRIAFSWFHRGLGLIYLFAIFPLFFQITSLIGSNGLMPAEELIALSKKDQGLLQTFLQFPSLFHFFQYNVTLYVLVGLGCVGGLMLVLSFRVFFGALLAWISFLSITSIGGDFFVIIIDLFLSEVGFLALFSTYYLEKHGYTPKLVDWVFRLLNFRLWFSMGVIKFYLPQDVWSNFTFFDYFFQAQPMPSPAAPIFQALPDFFKHAALIGLFLGEIIVPFFVFGGKRLRRIAFFTFVLISSLIQLTGNYGYFNVLSIILALLILKDGDLKLIRVSKVTNSTNIKASLSTTVKILLCYHILLQTIYCILLFQPNPHSPQNHFNYFFITRTSENKFLSSIAKPFELTENWRMCNPYGVFRGIPYYHSEIRLSGSEDSIHWQTYEFKYVPSGKTDYLGFYAPYYPRLDHLFFYETIAAPNYKWNPLNRYYNENNNWVCRFINKLLDNDPKTTQLMKHNPFEEKQAPNYIKAEVFRLSFTKDDNRCWAVKPMGISKIYSKTNICKKPIISFEEAMKTIYSHD